jgi:hypothetical protein
MTKDQLNAVLDGVRSWPQEDQDELVEVAHEIEARRTGVYVMTDDERAAIADARTSSVVADDKVRALWRRLGIA